MLWFFSYELSEPIGNGKFRFCLFIGKCGGGDFSFSLAVGSAWLGRILVAVALVCAAPLSDKIEFEINYVVA